MKSWVLVLVANEPYLSKAFQTIHQARTIGKWRDSICLLCPESLQFDHSIVRFIEDYSVFVLKIPDHPLEPLLRLWNQNPDHPNFPYVATRPFIYQKFNIFHTFFKQWEVVFYLDAGCQIQGPLERIKQSCEPNGILYAHSDAYPTYEWKLDRQFSFEIAPESMVTELKTLYNFNVDYFQTTLLIFDTTLIEDITVQLLFSLAEKYPISFRMDQGIINLLFLCEMGVWRQMPFADQEGFLYDFHEREGCLRRQYLIMKYPKQLL